MPPGPDTATAPVATRDIKAIAEEFTPERIAVELPSGSDRRDHAQREAALDSQLKDRVNEYCSHMSGRDLADVANQLLKNPNLDPKSAEALRSALENVEKNAQPLRDILFTALTGSEQKHLTNFNDLSPEDKLKAQNNLRDLLDTASDAKLKELYDRFGKKSDPAAQTREARLDALLQSDLLERSFKDPRVAIELSSVLEASGKLSPQMSALLGDLNSKARDSLNQLREVVGKEFLKLIHECLEEAVRDRLPIVTSKTQPINMDTTTTWPLYVDFLQALERTKDGTIFTPLSDRKDELAEGLAEEARALRDKKEKEEKQETEYVEARHALQREIRKIAQANPELFNKLCGIAVEQLSYIDPLTLAQRRSEYQSPLA